MTSVVRPPFSGNRNSANTKNRIHYQKKNEVPTVPERERRRPTESERFARAIRNVDSYPGRLSTVGAREFFDGLRLDDQDGWKLVPERLHRLCRRVKLESSGSGDLDSLLASVTAAVFASAPRSLLSSFFHLFQAGIRHHVGIGVGDHHTNNDDDDDALDFDRLWDDLRYLRWIPHKRLNSPLCAALHDVVYDHVSDLIQGEHYSAYLDKVSAWKDAVLVPAVRAHILTTSYASQRWDDRLAYATTECFCRVRVHEMFEIVADFPDSAPAVRELRRALVAQPRWRDALTDELRASLIHRLVHPGANTDQIIHVYVNTIKVLTMLDPDGHGALLEDVARPVRQYLRSRKDTVRCIVTSLTDEEEGGDLYQELRRQDARPLEEHLLNLSTQDDQNNTHDNGNHAHLDEEDDDAPPDPDWVPASKQRSVRVGGTASDTNTDTNTDEHEDGDDNTDILSMLVSIYGTKEVFVNEYRVLLADKLLKNLDYNTNKEVHNLELLKLRFGDVSMRQCEIMIKDLDDSRRIVANIRSTLSNNNNTHTKKKKPPLLPPIARDATVVDAAIVSHIFWPPLHGGDDEDDDDATATTTTKLHPRIQTLLDDFGREYAKLKNPRRLTYADEIGTVTLELEVTDDESGATTTREFVCSPLQATAIAHFEDRNTWDAVALAERTGLTEEALRGVLSYWITHGVVVLDGSDGGCYRLADGEDDVKAT